MWNDLIKKKKKRLVRAVASIARAMAPRTRSAPPPVELRQPEEEQHERSFALGSSGWLFIYYVGVIKALRSLGYNK